MSFWISYYRDDLKETIHVHYFEPSTFVFWIVSFFQETGNLEIIIFSKILWRNSGRKCIKQAPRIKNVWQVFSDSIYIKKQITIVKHVANRMLLEAAASRLQVKVSVRSHNFWPGLQALEMGHEPTIINQYVLFRSQNSW